MSYAIQTKESREQNKLYIEDIGIHNWYRFVLSFPPHLVRRYIHEFNLTSKSKILDPFCGTGTTIVEAKTLGILGYGVEANPVTHFVANTKIRWDINIDALLNTSQKIAKKTNRLIKNHKGPLKCLSPEKNKLLIKNSISALPLHKSLLLIEQIKLFEGVPFYDHLRLAFAKQLVVSFSNLHFGPEVGVLRKKKEDMDVVSIWLEQVSKIASDLSNTEKIKGANSKILLADSRTKTLPTSFDAVITSPPYPNEKDYTRTTRLESVLLEFLTSKEELRACKKTLLRSNTRNIYVSDDDEKYILKNKEIMELSKSIENKRIELGKTSGFERYYHRVVELYFGGIYSHLKSIKPFLNPGAKLAYVVGDQASYFQILIKTGKILGEIVKDIGYTLEGIDVFRTRLSTVTKKQLNEEVVIFSNT